MLPIRWRLVIAPRRERCGAVQSCCWFIRLNSFTASRRAIVYSRSLRRQYNRLHLVLDARFGSNVRLNLSLLCLLPPPRSSSCVILAQSRREPTLTNQKPLLWPPRQEFAFHVLTLKSWAIFFFFFFLLEHVSGRIKFCCIMVTRWLVRSGTIDIICATKDFSSQRTGARWTVLKLIERSDCHPLFRVGN